MPFKHIVDKKLDIVVLKARGDISVTDILEEIKKSIITRRGVGVRRRLIDMTSASFTFDLNDAEQILKMIQAQAEVLNPRKIALLFESVPKHFDMDKIRPLLSSKIVEIGVFTHKTDAVTFLNSKKTRHTATDS